MASMLVYSKAAVERAMKAQEVILQALAKKITWWRRLPRSSASVIGICGVGGSATKSLARMDWSSGDEASLRPIECRCRRWSRCWDLPGEVLRSERAALSREASWRSTASAGAIPAASVAGIRAPACCRTLLHNTLQDMANKPCSGDMRFRLNGLSLPAATICMASQAFAGSGIETEQLV